MIKSQQNNSTYILYQPNEHRFPLETQKELRSKFVSESMLDDVACLDKTIVLR